MFRGLNFLPVLVMALLVFGCEKKNDTVIDPSYDSPLIVSVTKSTDSVLTTSWAPVIAFDLSAVVNENGGGAIASIDCKLIDPLGGVVAVFGLNYLQEVSEGKKYAKSVSVSGISCLLVGGYTVELAAKNEAGLFSSVVNTPLFVRNMANVAPVVISTNLPDSVIRPVSGSIPLTISINVTDTDGSCDIKDVYFGAYRPNGNFIGFNPLTFSINNEWTFTNVVTPSSADSSYGYFKYQFFAKDRSDAVSAAVWDSIKFVRP